MGKNSLLILSGGMDSVTLLHDYASEIALAVSFNYGSNHNAREIEMAKLNAESLGIEHLVIDLAFIAQHFKSSLLEGAEAIPTDDYNPDNLRSTVVPFRNGIMLSIAAGIAESRGLANIMMANHGGDHEIYPDCRPEFVDAMNNAIMAGTFLPVKLIAPYTSLSKTEIALRGKQLGIDYTKTYSCYCGGKYHCGQCATCRERRKALSDAGIDDKTIYESTETTTLK